MTSTNPYAFPHGPDNSGHGLTLLDYFAAAALTGELAGEGDSMTAKKTAERAYELAAAMIARRAAMIARREVVLAQENGAKGENL